MPLKVDLRSRRKFMDISEVSRRAGVPASTLRYYESVGLIRSAGRHGLRRQFSPAVLERLALITLGQASGFSLGEIRDMFSESDDLTLDRTRLLQKAEELEIRVARLNAMRDGLLHAAACPAPRHLDCPTFRRLMTVAARIGRRNGPDRGFAAAGSGD
ncbi:helix-turn-helix domain-containing protein [Pacificimonas sp. WHA3]|uniref:Helix-turn-helix domain-containing protein n=2 Tax=Pacificimonas pallii TaxID=2827236 RepID=A0ABS6SI64_9SPHN|nr:helix-turn-helix domain-containing protein [Pacificimonas pallii]